MNYEHHSAFLNHVTMDDTTHSVYITGNFIGYTGKTGNGGSCTGEALIIMNHACNNLDTVYPGKRIKCLRYVGN